MHLKVSLQNIVYLNYNDFSGAGKTTLLNMLTFRNLTEVTREGEISVNGTPATRKLMTAYSAYVQQEDNFIGTMTVREHLVFNVSYTKWNRFSLF